MCQECSSSGTAGRSQHLCPEMAVGTLVRKTMKLIVEFDCKGQALGDIPGVCSKDGKIGHVSLLALYKGNKEKPRYKF